MVRGLVLILMTIIVFACKKTEEAAAVPHKSANTNSEAFDSAKWQRKVNMDYEFREDMYKGLIKSDTLKKLRKPGIIAMLGEPDRIDNNHLFYTISRKRLEFVTLHTRTMVIKLKPDESVEWVKIHE